MGKYLSRTDVRCICALICCALWGSGFPCVKIGYDWLDIETTENQILFAGYRFFLAGIMTFAVACILKKGLIKVSKKAVPHVLSVGFFQTTVQYVCFYIGMSNITGTKGSIINASSAFVSIIIAHFFVKGEHLDMNKAVGCILGLTGVILVNLNGFDMKSIWLLIYMAFISAAAFSIWIALLKYNQVSEISVFCFSIPVFGVMLSAALLGEDFTSPANLFALVCVSVGIIIVNTQRKRIK